MRAVKLKIGITDQIHVYSNAETILLQLRRNIPSEREIGNPSFKVATPLEPDIATKLANELLRAVKLHKRAGR